jgi:DNA-binding NtrC family response regulator
VDGLSTARPLCRAAAARQPLRQLRVRASRRVEELLQGAGDVPALSQVLHVTATQSCARPGRARPLRASLRIVYPESLAHSIALEAPDVVLGRLQAAGIQPLPHPTVSRRHLRVEWSPGAGAHLIFDLGSHNGCRLNGRQLAADTAAELAHGDAIQLGDVLAIYEIEPVEPSEEGAVSMDALPGTSVAMQRLRRTVARAGRDRSPVLLVGETGTGKEQIARELHRLSGRDGALLSVNCAALSRELVESQLFGHTRGAFTGALADHPGLFRAARGGTVFLDEIGDLPLDLQPKLLRALQEGEVLPVGATRAQSVDVRVIAATNRDLTTSVEAGLFRRDLYARLALWEIAVPALRDRRPDVLSWIDRLHRRWLDERPDQLPTPRIEFSPAAAEQVLLADWPENLRGLDRLVHEVATRVGGGRVELDDLPHWVSRSPAPERGSASSGRSRTGARAGGTRRPTPSAEELTAAMREHAGSMRAVARRFGRDRRQIYRWLDAFGLNGERRGMR